ncbi:LysR family transcriptional regulator [Bacillus sp. JCM 19034]|uniref:LysR family transcriptional regulator n=1 Tax=Bacillus sp. JCM 19034 TaxID=1481928 RepID=UPI000781F209|nr:LysR family transcriptional regulator [Bacillus sp. JCM 19034]
MELLQLEYFQRVARLEHLTKASEELHVSQPSLSKTIARLEKDLGVPLFDRKNRQMKLNEYGHLFLKQVDIALSALEEGRRQIADQADLQNSRVILSSTDHKCDAELVSSFLTASTQANLRIKRSATDQQNLEWLINEDIDFFISSLPIQEQGIEAISFLTEEIYLAVSKEHPLAQRTSIHLQEASNEPFVGFRTGDHFRTLTDHFCFEAGFQPKIVCEIDGFSAANSFVEKGIGVAFLTREAKEQDAAVQLIPIEEPTCHRTFQIAWKKDRYLSNIARTFRDFLIHYYDSH